MLTLPFSGWTQIKPQADNNSLNMASFSRLSWTASAVLIARPASILSGGRNLGLFALFQFITQIIYQLIGVFIRTHTDFPGNQR